MKIDELTIIGYSGHAFVAIEIAHAAGYRVSGYFDAIEKSGNPYQIVYYGSNELEVGYAHLFEKRKWFVAIGNNSIRSRIQEDIIAFFHTMPATIIHPSAQIAIKCEIGDGTMIASQAVVNPMAVLGKGVICNTGAIIEHECTIGEYAHIAPGAVLAGNVKIGEHTFIGANSVCRQGIVIGANCTIGAGAVVVKNVPDNTIVAGNPARILTTKK